ncbi:MAG TPA: glycosyltransferase [Phycisphaerae bacterium]|nr:glycosyltransferase [Phycisphaerae bacterium]
MRSLAEQSRPRVALGIPVLHAVGGREFYAHLRVVGELSLQADWILPMAYNLVPYARARNCVVDKAVEHDCDYVYFVDADQTIPPGAYGELLRVLRERGAAVVSGNYVKRGYPYDPVWAAEWDEWDSDGEPAVLHGCGLGCALIDLRWVRANLAPPWFDVEAGGPSEDYDFCNRVRAAGGLILGHPGILCGHATQDTPPVTAANRRHYQTLYEMDRPGEPGPGAEHGQD